MGRREGRRRRGEVECGVNGEGDEDKGSDGVTRIGRVGHGWEMVNWSALLSALLEYSSSAALLTIEVWCPGAQAGAVFAVVAAVSKPLVVRENGDYVHRRGRRCRDQQTQGGGEEHGTSRGSVKSAESLSQIHTRTRF